MKKNTNVHSLGEYYFEEFFYRFPVKATKRGIHRYDYRLGSFRRSDFEAWKKELSGIGKEIFAFKLKKRFKKNIDLQMLERRVNSELEWVKEEEFKSSPFFYISAIYDGLIYPAFGAYAPLSVRSKNFLDRASDIENVVTAAKENLEFSEETEKEFALERLNLLSNFFEEYVSYLSGKSDVGLKEELKSVRLPVSEQLKSLYTFVSRLRPASNAKKLTFVKKIKREYLEDYPLRELQLDLKKRIEAKSVQIEQKAREIKISSPVKETLENVLSEKKEMNLEEVFEIFELIKKYGNPIFGKTDLSIEYKRIVQNSERNFGSLARLSSNIIIPPGPFDTHSSIPVMIVAPVSVYTIILKLLSVGYPGRSFQSEILKQNTTDFRKMFENTLFNEGWEFYSRIIMRDALKKELGLKFELVALYDEYVTLLKAFIENELLNRKVSLSDAINIVNGDNIILNKEDFLYNTIAENGKSLKAVVGLNSILYFKDKLIRKGLKLKEFHRNILANSTLPFKLIGQVMRR